jgi:hypothetical protein
MVADAIFDSVALFRIEAVQMLRAIDRLQLCVPFLFALSDSIGATASQCPWPGRGKRGVCHCPEGTLDRFLDGRCANRPFGDVCPLRLPLIVSEAGFELGLDARKCDQPEEARSNALKAVAKRSRALWTKTHPAAVAIVWGAGRKQAEVVSVIVRCESLCASDRVAINH